MSLFKFVLGGLWLPLRLYLQPKTFRDEIAALAPDLPMNYSLWQARRHLQQPEFRRALLYLSEQCVVALLWAPLLMALIEGFGFHGNWEIVAAGLAAGVAFGLAFEVWLNVAFGVVFGVVFGVELSVTLALADTVVAGVMNVISFGMVIGVALGVALNVVFGVTVGVVVGVMISMAVSIAVGGVVGGAVGVIAFGATFGVEGGAVVGAAFGAVGGVVGGVASIFMTTHLANLLWHIPASVLSLVIIKFYPRASPLLWRLCPARWDEVILIPLPGLPRLLAVLYRQNLVLGELALKKTASRLIQRRAAFAAWTLLAQEDASCITSLPALAQFTATLGWLNEDTPLPQTTRTLLLRLRDASRDVAAALESDSATNQLNRLREAQRLLQSLNKQALGEFATPVRYWIGLVEAGLIEAQRRQQQAEPISQVYCGDGRPVRPDGRPDTEVPFKGRAALFRRLEHALGGTDGQRATYALFGQRRTGKTSALLQLERRLGSRVVAAFIDMQSEKLGGASDNAGLLHGLAAAVNDEARRRDCILPDLTLRNLQNDPFPAFGRWLDAVEKTLSERRLLLCLDEFEALEIGIADKRFDQRILTCLRNIVQHRRHVYVLLSGSHQIDELPPHWASALINTLSLPISFLEEDDARDLIEHPVADFPAIYRSEAVQCILYWSHRQPYLIQLLCQLLVERMNKAGRMPPASWVESADVDAIVPLALERGVSYFSDLWHSQSGGDAAKRLLEALAERPDTTLDGTALQAIEPDRHLLNQVLRTLLRREIVERREDGRFAIIVPLVGEYVRSQRLV